MTDIQKEHYFDWAATSPSDKDILVSALNETLEKWGNPSSIHTAGKEARGLLEEARKNCAKTLGVPAETIYFTSGGTESDHIALLSVLNRQSKSHVLFSSIEHPAVREMANELKKCGVETEEIPSDSDGIIQPETVVSMLRSNTVLVCVMAVNNETGAIQPVYKIADAVYKATEGKRRPRLHVDCVQAAGKIPFNLNYRGIDSAAFSAHKICGPRGIGIFYSKNAPETFLRGGGQEKGIRSGTENVYGALAFSRCLEKYYISSQNKKMEERFSEQKKYCGEFIRGLTQLECCSIIPKSRPEKMDLYSPWIVQASFKNIPGQVLLRALDAEGFYISTGSACSSRKNNRPVLKAMHVTQDESETAVRFSFGSETTENAMKELLAKVREIAGKFNS